MVPIYAQAPTYVRGIIPLFFIRKGTLTAGENGSIDKPYFTFCHERWGSLIDRPQLMAWLGQLCV
jgi:hypothetical protein